MILSLDPGINGNGVALFTGSGLQRAFYARPSWEGVNTVSRAVACAQGVVRGLTLQEYEQVARDTICVEWMQVYHHKGKGDVNKILFPLIAVAAAVCAFFPLAAHVSYLPREWKGTLDGDAMVERIKGKLTVDEKKRCELPAPGIAHNVYDAVGIGLKYLGRLEKQRVFPR